MYSLNCANVNTIEKRLMEGHTPQNHEPNVLPIDVRWTSEGYEKGSVLVQNYIIKNLSDGNLELIFCNGENFQEPDEAGHKSQNLLDMDVISPVNKNNTFVLDMDLDARINKNNREKPAMEVSVIKNYQSESVNQEMSVSTSIQQSKPNSITQTKIISQQIPILSKPERMLLNIYSCFKCDEQFNSITSFRHHLKWHKAEKNFNCTKCSAGFNAENNLKIHMVTSHPGHHMDVCPICKIKFQRKASLKSHIMIHQVEEFFTCDECHGEFQNDDELFKHMEIHAVTRVTKSDSLVCPYCKLDFNTLAEYKQHIEKHVEVKRNVLKGKKIRKKKPREKPGGHRVCKYCGKIFTKGSLLDRHERIHTGERPYVCRFCKKAFAQKGTLQIHLGSHTGEKPYSCTLCQAKFTQKGNLRAHIEKTHTAPKGNQNVYKCTQCPCIFRKIATLNGHITKVHINHVQESENIVDKVMDNLMKLNNEFGKSALKKNVKTNKTSTNKTSASPASANVAEMGCVKLAESHASGGVRRYLVRQKKIGDVRWYFCNFCSSSFKKPSDLIRHFRTHTLEKPYKCKTCNQAFSLKSTLINHNKIHNKTGCQCDHCDIRFRNPKNFKAHVRKHEPKVETPNYTCTLCDKVFVTMEEGKEHRAEHEDEITNHRNIIEPILKQPLYQTTYGSLPLKPPKCKVPNTGAESPLERPHHCKICDARFTRLMSLKRHLLHHSKERKFKCTLCPKAFVTKYKLQEHVAYHKNIRNYGCQKCGKKFVTGSLLKRHMIVHNDFKPYLCPYCEKHFKTLLLCRSHIRTVHKLSAYEAHLEGPSSKNYIKSETLDNSTSENTTNAASFTDKNAEKLPSQTPHEVSNNTISSMEHSSVNPQQNPVMLSVTSQENQQESNPGYRMVYLNICDLPETSTDGVLNENNILSSLKLENDSLLFNPLTDLQDSGTLFNLDTNKSDMVDPNEVIKSTATLHYTPSVIRTSQNKSPPDKMVGMATGRRNDYDKHGNADIDSAKKPTLSNLPSLSAVGDLPTGQQGISLQDFSAVDLGGLPISIIGTEDATALSSNLVNGEININPNDMFFDTQVICINCHKIFSDMNMFQKHVCSEDPNINVSENMDLLLAENGDANLNNELVNKAFKSADNHTKEIQDVVGKNTNFDLQIAEQDQVESFPEKTPVASVDNEPLQLDRMKRFKYKKALLKDVYKLENAMAFRCKECSFMTTIEEKYRKHMSFNHANNDKVCKFCFKDFKKNSDLLRHLRTHTGERPFECEKCHKKFSLKSTLESHMRTHESIQEAKIICGVCYSNFTTKSSLKVHMLLHTGVRPHACTFCEQTFRTSASRKAHEKNTHLNKNKQNGANKPKTGPKLLKSLAEKMNNKNEGSNIVTKIVEPLQIQPSSEALILNSSQDSVAIDPVLLLQHLQNSGIILTTDNDSSVPININDLTLLDLKTTVGGSAVANDSDVRFITDIENYQVGDVEVRVERVMNESELLKSEPPAPKQQKIVQKVECDICHKLYASKDVLRKHKKNVHGQNKKFPCIKCDKGYDKLEELNKHIVKLHMGYRPYACQYCANSFSEENSLKTHIKRIHQKSLIAQETTNALLGLQFDLPAVSNNSLL